MSEYRPKPTKNRKRTWETIPEEESRIAKSKGWKKYSITYYATNSPKYTYGKNKSHAVKNFKIKTPIAGRGLKTIDLREMK